MTQKLRLLAGVAAGAALAFSSCAYDPYYGGTSVGASYSTGSSYGGSSSIFVSTGDPRWGYDPYCRSYYDYNRRAYYDPYLYGYYPVGYRPSIIIGTPHPYGWREGRYCPPPRRVTNVTISNYRDRERNYRNSDYSWSRQVRQSQPGRDGYRPPGGGGQNQNRFDGRDRDRNGPSNSPRTRRDDDRPDRSNSPQIRGNQGRPQPQPEIRSRENSRPDRSPSRYNTPVQTREQVRPEVRGNQERRAPEGAQRARSAPPQGQPARRAESPRNGREKKNDDNSNNGKLRGPGEGYR